MVANTIKKTGKGLLRTIRVERQSRLFWSRDEPKNFGDWVGPYLYEQLAGRTPVFSTPSNWDLGTVYTAAGSILRHAAENCIVWGSGIISRADTFPRPHRVLAVRGPHTRQRMHDLGYSCPAIYGDPALLLPQLYQPQTPVRHALGVIPHFTDYDEVREAMADQPDVMVIDVAQPVEAVVDDIAACEATVTSSLHGLIVSQAYGVPSGAVAFSDRLQGDGVKFEDHYGSAGIEAPPPPRRIDLQMKASELLAIVRDAPQPDLSPLADPLLAACPFPRRDV